jgi:phosphoglycerate-specific signal transduction histidine kinase
MEQINSGIDQLKQRNTELQDQLTQKTTVECELEYLQGTVIQLKHSNDELKKEQDKLL